MNYIEEKISELYRSPYEYTLMELTFSTREVSEGLTRKKDLSNGNFKVFALKIPVDLTKSKVIFHVGDNPVNYFSFELFAYFGGEIGKKPFYDEKTKFYDKAYVDFSVNNSILFNFKMISNEGKRYVIDLNFKDLLDFRHIQIIDEFEGLNIIDNYYL